MSLRRARVIFRDGLLIAAQHVHSKPLAGVQLSVRPRPVIHGMTANAFTSVSLDPALVLVCVDHRARTHAQLHARKRFGVNVLRSDQQAIAEYYASAAETHQHAEAAGARFDRTAHRTPVLQGALAYLECRLHSTETAGDHTIFIAEVEEVVVRDGEPLLYFRSQYRDIEAPQR